MAEEAPDAPYQPQEYRSAPSESLNVIGLISGGKDSFYSLLHCLRNGHQIVALGNLYPPVPTPKDDHDGEEDLNSFMYQTVGHTVIPTYEKLTGKPLYRQEILGGAVQTASSYANPTDDGGDVLKQDETESLTLLLKRIMKEHPEANAVCSGAILSTYQRTRIESVALRLGLVPLAYLWQYTVVRPESQSALLMDMYDAGLDARIVKVASGGLDERNLWMRVTDPKGVSILENKLRKFGLEGDGAVIGEGGEYETVVVGGPGNLFRGRVEIDSKDLTTVSEGGGTEWLKIGNLETVMKGTDQQTKECRVPNILDSTFESVASRLRSWEHDVQATTRPSSVRERPRAGTPSPYTLNQTFCPSNNLRNAVIEEQAIEVIASIQQYLISHSLSSTSIITSHIILPSMDHFQIVNKWYGSLFKAPNPPSRVTISCKSNLPTPQTLQIQLTFYTPPSSLTSHSEVQRKALHVQSRSYWAPANIGPYSQAVAYSCTPSRTSGQDFTNKRAEDSDDESSDSEEQLVSPTLLVKIAGQIPLLPASMALPVSPPGENINHFKSQAVLSLQHLWRIGVAMNVKWFVGAVAYIPSRLASSRDLDGALCSRIVARTWDLAHDVPSTESDGKEDDHNEDEDDFVDVWDQRNNRAGGIGSGLYDQAQTKPSIARIPDWNLVQKATGQSGETCTPPVFTAMIDGLPRDADVEWHAFTGIGSGVTSIIPQIHQTDTFTIYHQTTSSFITHTIISLHSLPPPHELTPSSISQKSSRVSILNDNLSQALEFLQLSRESFAKMANLACLDARYGEWWSVEGGVQVVTCNGVWDGQGREIVGFWVLEGIV